MALAPKLLRKGQAWPSKPRVCVCVEGGGGVPSGGRDAAEAFCVHKLDLIKTTKLVVWLAGGGASDRAFSERRVAGHERTFACSVEHVRVG